MLITDQYRDLNRELHERNPAYGTSGQKYVDIVRKMMVDYTSMDVLDYGCGKRTLERALRLPIANYDPAVPGLEATPDPHDIVACTDVLEHIEPDCLDDVLADIRRCTVKAALLIVATRPAMKTLADGRNAHLIVEGEPWWRERIKAAGFKLRQVFPGKGEFAVVAEPARVAMSTDAAAGHCQAVA